MNAEKNIRETNAHRASPASRRPEDGRSRIILAEDDHEMAALLIRAFEKAGYEIAACHDGWELLKLLGIFPPGEIFKDVSLVISDIRMPGISGLEALKTCGYMGEFPPVIIITAFGDKSTHKQARELGAVDIVDKPFDIDELIAKVRRLVPPA